MSDSFKGNEERLTDQSYWEGQYGRETAEAAHPSTRTAALLTQLFGNRAQAYTEAWHRHLLWHHVLRGALPISTTHRVVEIGSAPGFNLVKFRQLQGYEPFGIEYTEHGASLNRRVFADHGISSSNVLHADFFDDAFRATLARHLMWCPVLDFLNTSLTLSESLKCTRKY